MVVLSRFFLLNQAVRGFRGLVNGFVIHKAYLAFPLTAFIVLA